MPRSISPQKLVEILGTAECPSIVDVRREAARQASNKTIPGAKRFLPNEVQDWATTFSGETVVVFCVHGHEVSQAVCHALRQHDVDACYLEGGFETWLTVGLPAQPLDPLQ